MAKRVNAAPTEHDVVVKDEPCKEIVDAHQSLEVGNPTGNIVAADCTNTSKVSPKHSMEGNGDGKPVKPGKDVPGVAGKGGGSTARSPDNEVFIPAPPPATNAWTKRMQASCSAAKPAAESASVDDKHGTARSASDSSKPAPAKKQSPNPVPTDHSAKSDPQSSRLRLEDSAQTENTSSSGASVSKKTSAESAENPPSSKQTDDVRLKPVNKASSKAEVPVKSTSSAIDTAPGGCWKKPVATAHVQSACEASVAQGSTATKQHSTELSAGVTSTEEPRRWETVSPTSQQSSAVEHNSESAGLNDSANWPSLNKAADKVQSSGSESVPAVLPSSSASDETASDEKTTVVQNHIKRLSDSGNDDPSAKDTTTSQDVAAENKQSAKKKGKGNKQKWRPYEIELPKTRRRPVAGRPRASSQERSRATPESARDGPRNTREGARRREGRGGGSGRESSERTTGSARRNRRDTGEKAAQSSEDREPAESSKSATAETPHSDKGHGATSTSISSSTSTGRTTSTATVSPAHVGYQGSRRSANRGHATYRGRGSRFPAVWSTPTFQYLQFAGAFDPTQQYYCHIETPTPTPTFYTPIVSQSDYYTSILADDATKKLIAQQIEYYFSTENLVKDFFLRRQMDTDGWIAVELLASFRRVRIHTGSVNTQIIVDSLTGSKMVEISEDKKHMRTRDDPGKWSLSGVEPKSFSSLDASVPEFVPGQTFRVAATQFAAADTGPLQSSDKVSPAMDAASEVSSRLEEMSVSMATAAKPTNPDDASAAGDVGNSGADVQPITLADVENSKDALIERLHTSSDDERCERSETPKSSPLISDEPQTSQLSVTTAGCDDQPSSPEVSTVLPPADSVASDTEEKNDVADVADTQAVASDA